MSNNAKPSQDFVPIKEIRDGIVVLKDDSLRAVLMASSINFALKSQDEQEATLAQFQNFLNSLDFTVQFNVQSRDLDIRPYVAMLEERYKEQTNDLMKIQTREYIEFIKTFTESVNIMSKTFYIIVPYDVAVVDTKGVLSSVLPSKSKEKDKGNERFETARTQLEQRIAVVEQGLVRTGVRVIQLGTEELVELYYKTFNPGDTEKPIALDKQQ